MKFISKSSNLLVVLRPGLPAQPLSGMPAKPTISVRFKDGIAEIQQQELIDMMIAHPGFNNDFVSADVDPYAAQRKFNEPTHVITEMKFGTPVSKIVSGGTQLPLEMQKLVQEMAVNLAKSMLPSMLESALKEIVKVHEATKEKDVVVRIKKKPGRKPKVKITEVVETIVESVPVAETENPLAQESVS